MKINYYDAPQCYVAEMEVEQLLAASATSELDPGAPSDWGWGGGSDYEL